MRKQTFIEFAVNNNYLDPVTVCSGIWPEDHVEDQVYTATVCSGIWLEDHVRDPAYIAYYKYLDDLHNRSLFKKVIDYVFAK